MKRTLVVTLVMVGLSFAIFTGLRGRQQQLLAWQEARNAEARAQALAGSLPPVSLPGKQGEVDSASNVELPTVETRGSETQQPSADNTPDSYVGKDRPVTAPANEALVEGAAELKVFHLENADASEALRVIQPLVRREAKVSADQQTNSLIVSANADRLAVITALLIMLDEAPAKKQLPLPAKTDSQPNYLPPSVLPTSRLDTTVVPKDNQDATMERETKQLAVRVRAAKEPEKSKLRAELEVLIEKHFQYRQERRKQEISELANRVDYLRQAHQRRQENEPDILKRRIADLLDEENELRWDEVQSQPKKGPPTASVPAPKIEGIDLSGEWLVTMPAGFQFIGKIEKRPEGCWAFVEMRNLSGFYQLKDGFLRPVAIDRNVIIDGEDARDLEWLIVSNDMLVLTKAPQNISSDYRGATLRRGAKATMPPERPRVPHGSGAAFPISPFGGGEAIAPDSESRQAAIAAARRKMAEARLRQAKSEFETAVESNRKVSQSVSSTEIERLRTNVTIAEAELEIAIADGTSRKDPADARPSEAVFSAKLGRAEAQLKAAKIEVERMQKLADSRVVSRKELDRATAQLEEAEANVAIAKAELEDARRAGHNKTP